jgi:carbamoyl-phosphate synthase small subunit
VTTARWPVALVLENGRVFKGEGFGARVESIGEVVFNTSITGYQEIISDPSYCGQIVVMTATQIGNVGVNDADREGRKVVTAGFAIRELSPIPASWRSEDTLPHWLETSGVPGIDGIDTRALTRVLRDQGAMNGAVTPHVAEIEAVLARVRAAPKMDGLDLVPRVTTPARYEWTEPTWRAIDDGRAVPTPPIKFHVVAYDFGIKENILRQLRDIGCRVTVVPATTPGRDALALRRRCPTASQRPRSCARAGSPCSASASVTRSSVWRSARRPRSCRSATTAVTIRCSTRRPGRSRSPPRTTASSWIRRRSLPACTSPT